MAVAKYKVNEDPEILAEANRLRNEFSCLSFQLYEWIRKAQKVLPRRNQRFERSCDALTNKLYLISELFLGLTVTGNLPEFHSAENSKW